jgi:hypothetical protein
MNRVYYLLVLLMLVACGKKQAISYKEYKQAHERDRTEHLRLIVQDTWLFDTLARQSIENMQEKKRPEHILDSWEHTAEYFNKMCLNQQVYSRIVVYNDKTDKAIMKMWKAENELTIVNSLKTHDVTFEIKFESDYNKAIGIIQAMRTDVKKAMERMLQGAQEYQKIVFEPK